MNNNEFESLNGKAVLVTGAASGLGARITMHYLEKHANVIGIDIKSNPFADSERLIWVTADLSDENAVANAVKTITQEFEALEIVVNCAGVFEPDPPAESISPVLMKLLKGNFISSSLLTFKLYSLLKSGDTPLVVNVASADAIVASAGQDCEIGVSHDILYASTKGGVVSFTKALAMKWAPDRIRVNAICPTVFESPISADLFRDPQKIEKLSSYIPLGRLCTTTDVATAVDCLYMLKMTTGHTLPVDGGYLCL